MLTTRPALHTPVMPMLATTMYPEVTSNRRRSAVLTFGFLLFVALVALAFAFLFRGGIVGIVVALVVAVLLSAGAYWRSDAIALRLSRARPASLEDYTRYHNLVEGLCIASGLPKPRLYVIDDPAPNAFATGRNPRRAAVAVTTGLLDTMNRVELEGVLAHELSHIRNYDILLSTLAVTMVGFLAVLADLGIRMLWWNMGRSSHRRYDSQRGRGGGPQALLALAGFALLVVAPLVARVLHFAVSRQRETLADVSAIEMTRYPPGLISALEKLRDDSTVVHAASHATAHLWFEEPEAQTPAEGKLSRINRLFRTHPPIEDRIALLREL